MQQALHDVSAWLVINSMRTECVQFDQLCSQNLANIWRQVGASGHRPYAWFPRSRAWPSLSGLICACTLPLRRFADNSICASLDGQDAAYEQKAAIDGA
eukprot:2408431-Pleurochrysis_carterae.AAC.1